MAKLTKRIVDAADVREKDYFVWDDELPGFGLRVFASGKRSYLIQYRAAGRTRRYTIGLHGVWTPETARQEAKVQLGRVARGDGLVVLRLRHQLPVDQLRQARGVGLGVLEPRGDAAGLAVRRRQLRRGRRR